MEFSLKSWATAVAPKIINNKLKHMKYETELSLT